jgi:DnaK suppressor protein
MDDKYLKQFSNTLGKIKREIEKRIKRLLKITDFGDDVDVDQETDESEEYLNQLAIAQTLKCRLADIESALRKIKKGRYGICEKCQKKISLNILKITPESKFCQECKKKK